jgi:hypothetical protein
MVDAGERARSSETSELIAVLRSDNQQLVYHAPAYAVEDDRSGAMFGLAVQLRAVAPVLMTCCLPATSEINLWPTPLACASTEAPAVALAPLLTNRQSPFGRGPAGVRLSCPSRWTRSSADPMNWVRRQRNFTLAGDGASRLASAHPSAQS